MKDLKTGQEIILARDAQPGKTYLLAGMYYSITIVKKYGDDQEYVSSVLVQSEREPFRQIAIAGGTELIEFDEALHVSPAVDSATGFSKQSSRKGSSMPQQKNPRSKVIDKLLAETKAGTEPDWEAIAAEVIKQGCAPQDKKKSIISQAKVRYKWYTSEGKQNPATVSKTAKK